MLQKYILYAAYGFLVFTGTMHFAIDVASQYFRGVRAPGPATTLYYGLNSSFALGQVVLGALGVWLAFRAPDVLRGAVPIAVSLVAAGGWLALTFFFMEYWPPRINAAIFGVLVLAIAVTGRS